MNASDTAVNTLLYRRLGYAGLAPFVLCAALVLFAGAAQTRALGLTALLSYAAVVAAFIGAVHWGVWLAESSNARQARLVWGVVPSIASWCLLLLSPAWALTGFIALFVLMLVVDLRLLPFDYPGYGSLRRNLTLGVLACLALAMPHAWNLA